ncbi:hypothetical protein [Micromonospora avicenniae]|uniref:hypothetical protein n=1 Tax=Micromonospora avicenniae TaxID=1198245 RepID=UPI00342AFF48
MPASPAARTRPWQGVLVAATLPHRDDLSVDVKVDAPTTRVGFHLPSGEEASSVVSREQGTAAQDFVTSAHTVTLAPGEGA